MYYRLMFLELQALVAGLDYEVECKTYVENLINMALENNFTLIKHERIYMQLQKEINLILEHI